MCKQRGNWIGVSLGLGHRMGKESTTALKEGSELQDLVPLQNLEEVLRAGSVP